MDEEREPSSEVGMATGTGGTSLRKRRCLSSDDDEDDNGGDETILEDDIIDDQSEQDHDKATNQIAINPKPAIKFSEKMIEVYQTPWQPSATPTHLQHRFMASSKKIFFSFI